MPHQPTVDEQDIPDNIQQGSPEPQERNHPLNPERPTREKIMHHPLINGLQLQFFCKNRS
jgi:hypothetical protein